MFAVSAWFVQENSLPEEFSVKMRPKNRRNPIILQVGKTKQNEKWKNASIEEIGLWNDRR